MPVEDLFAKCPVLPADANISIAKYLSSIKQALRQSSESEETGDLERAALLQIRVLQLICKTLPTHPEYELAENRPVVKELRGIAHTGFSNAERLADLLEENDSSKNRNGNRRRRKLQRVEISRGVVDLFERVAAENTARSVCTIGILAGRRGHSEASSSGESNASGHATEENAITALVIPSQTSLADRSDVRYESDVLQLLEVKGLLPFGMIEVRPNEDRLAMSTSAARVLAVYQRVNPEAVGIIIVPSDPERVGLFCLTEDGHAHVLSCIESEETPAEDIVPDGEPGEGKTIWSRAKHLNVAVSGEPFFKLYDLRGLALARDEQERNMKPAES